MKVMLQSGVILESNNESVYVQLLKYGGKEVKDVAESTEEKPTVDEATDEPKTRGRRAKADTE